MKLRPSRFGLHLDPSASAGNVWTPTGLQRLTSDLRSCGLPREVRSRRQDFSPMIRAPPGRHRIGTPACLALPANSVAQWAISIGAWQPLSCSRAHGYNKRQAGERLKTVGETVDIRLPEAFWLLVPTMPDPKEGRLDWRVVRLQGQEPLALRASKRMTSERLLLTQYVGSVLAATDGRFTRTPVARQSREREAVGGVFRQVPVSAVSPRY
jgi:hypothetical protein